MPVIALPRINAWISFVPVKKKRIDSNDASSLLIALNIRHFDIILAYLRRCLRFPDSSCAWWHDTRPKSHFRLAYLSRFAQSPMLCRPSFSLWQKSFPERLYGTQNHFSHIRARQFSARITHLFFLSISL